MYPILLSGKTVSLRELAEEDAPALHLVYGDSEATRHLSFEARTLEDVAEIVRSAINSASNADRTGYMLAVTGRATGELIGAGRLALGEHQSGQIGFALRPDQWGSGKGRQLVELLLRLGFAELGLHRIWGARSPLNEASARTMRAAGMVEEGRIRGHLFTRGAWRDSIVHSILSDEMAIVGPGELVD